MPARFRTLRHPYIFVYPTQRRMNDPFLDSLNDEQPLQVPLSPSRPVTPAVNPAASNVKIDSAVPHDATTLFDPLGSIPTNSHITRVPVMAAMTGATPKVASDPSAQTKRQAGMLTIPMPTNSPPASGDPHEDPLGTRAEDDAGPRRNSRTKLTGQFSTTPLFQPPPMAHKHSLVPPHSTFSHPSPHVRGPSDDFGSFVSVPPSLDPLSPADPPSSLSSSLSVDASGNSERKLNTTATITNESTTGARKRHAEKANRTLGEFALSEAAGGDFLGSLDDDERGEDSKVDVEVPERRPKVEEGPPCPPATPTSGPPPTT
jgi:hypothetical protein